MMDRLGSKSAIAAVVFWLGLGNWSAAGALTIYRIGGELAPLPSEVQEGKAEFRQLSWEDVDPELGGGSEGVRQDQDGIEPLFFAPNESLTQTIGQRGGYLQRHVYTGFTEDDKVNPVADGDPTTSYEELQPIESDHTVFGTDFLFDLGGLFPVNRVKFYPPPGKEDRVVEAALVGTSTGKEDPNSIPIQHRFQSRLHGFGIVLDIVGEITGKQTTRGGDRTARQGPFATFWSTPSRKNRSGRSPRSRSTQKATSPQRFTGPILSIWGVPFQPRLDSLVGAAGSGSPGRYS